jgi:hypothetical protein
MDCPKCGLVNPASDQICDCGYDFDSKMQETPYSATDVKLVFRDKEGYLTITLGHATKIWWAWLWRKFQVSFFISFLMGFGMGFIGVWIQIPGIIRFFIVESVS